MAYKTLFFMILMIFSGKIAIFRWNGSARSICNQKTYKLAWIVFLKKKFYSLANIFDISYRFEKGLKGFI